MNNAAKKWLDANPNIDNYLAAICDLNGILRGKRIPLSQAGKIFKGDIRMPLSICYLDIWGEEISNSSFITDTGDSDGICHWTGRMPMLMDWMPTPAAFVPLWLKNEDGSNFMGDPRCVLANIVDRFKEKGLRPVVATELEFYLYDGTGDKPTPPICPLNGKVLSSDSILTLSELQQFDAFLNDIYAACKAQDIPADSATAENGPGQFEINLLHTDDILKAADDTILFKEIVRGVAIKHNFCATFMAKPYGDRAGNGMHVHFSLIDNDGNNIFDDGSEQGSNILKKAVAGLLEAMPDQILIFAPHANSYRRLRLGSYAPTFAAWGYENRTTSIRIPGGSNGSRRIEHRVAGGDSNPYLVLAAILSAALDGIERDLNPPNPIVGNAYGLDLPPLASSWAEALEKFKNSKLMPAHLSPILHNLFFECKRQEIDVFAQQVTDFEYQSYLESI